MSKIFASARSDALDALRGVAMVWMTVFHFCFDLNHFGFWRADFYRDPVWTWQRAGIVSLFVFCAGVGQALSWARDASWKPFWPRWRQIATAALLVTLGSWLVFPHTFIYFGILHGMAVITILVRWLASTRCNFWALGGLALTLPWLAQWAFIEWPWLSFLNEPGFNSLGLISRKPVTQDYAPIFPWLGMALWGLAAGRWLQTNRPQWLQVKTTGVNGGLAALGRWSLSYYLLHQPVLMGLLWLINLTRQGA